MSPNASLPLHFLKSSKNDQATTVDIDAIMDNVSIILYTLTVVVGITGNTVVIWMIGFKLKVDNVLQKYFFQEKGNDSLMLIVLFIFITRV